MKRSLPQAGLAVELGKCKALLGGLVLTSAVLSCGKRDATAQNAVSQDGTTAVSPNQGDAPAASSRACESCTRPSFCVEGTCKQPYAVLRVKQGSAAAELGVDTSNGLGPASFAVRDNGLIVVADTVNDRLQGFRGGNLEFTFPLPKLASDMVMLDDTRIAVLADSAPHRVEVFDLSGKLLNQTPLLDVASGVDATMADQTAMLHATQDGLFVRFMAEQSRSVRYLLADGKTAPSPKIAFSELVSADGKQRYAGKLAASQFSLGRAPLQPGTAALSWSALSDRVSQGWDLETDAGGRTYALLPQKVLGAYHYPLLVLDARGSRTDEFEIQEISGSAEVARRFTVTQSGAFYVMDARETMVQIIRYR